jgi:hypothetical protein
VTVGANDIAFRNLGLDPLQLHGSTDQRRDLRELVRAVVELENQDIGLAACT